MSKTIAAFFDIDGTFYRDSMVISHFEILRRFDLISNTTYHKEVKPIFKEWKSREKSYEDFLEVLVEVYRKEIIGINKSVLKFSGEQTIKKYGDQVVQYTLNAIKWHKEQGHKVIFISGSPDYLVEKIAKKYDVDLAFGSEYLFNTKYKFTGEVVPMWDSKSKQNKIKELVQEYNIDLKKSYAYGDTMGDLTMLETVGNPVAINPNKKLLNALQEKIADKAVVVIERKDVSYKWTLSNNSIEIVDIPAYSEEA